MEQNSKKNKIEKAEKTEVKAEKVSLIYCGGNFPAGKLASFTVFKDGIPSHIEGLIKECPAIRSLFVPVEKFALTMQKINDKNSAEHQIFKQVEKFRLGVK